MPLFFGSGIVFKRYKIFENMITVLTTIMRKHCYLKIISLLLLASVSAWGQSTPNMSDFSKISDVLPPSPNAASLGKYGGLDLSLATGTANINISVYEYASSNLKVPVSLSYSSNGFKVDELAGRVGTNWSLNAGGVITRTVYGGADEFAQRLATPADFPARSAALLEFMEALASSSGGYGPQDAQPDLFSFNFNGFSGRFILDANLDPVLLAHSNLKIEKDFLSTTWNFKITTPDGVQYYFGGESATEKTKKIQFGAGCGKDYTGFIPTAWYLQKIVHPNNDEIVFSYTPFGTQYETGINQAIYQRDNLQQPAACIGYTVTPPVLQNTICTNILQTSGVLLQEINSTGGTKIKFIYTDRLDGNDKLLTDIELYQPGQSTTTRRFSLNYVYALATNFKNSFSNGDTRLNYRPFLTGFTEKSSDGLLTKDHSFAYNDINALPPRLSFAQDHYGFFNGQNNTTLIPTPTTLTWQQKLPAASANRNVDPTSCQKGLLSSVTYPTRGRDSIIYEPNQVYQQVATYPSPTTVSAAATNLHYVGGPGATNYSSPAVVSFQQEAMISGQCVSNDPVGDPIHDQSTITLLDENNTVIYSISLVPGNSFNEVLNLGANHTYTIKCNAQGENVTGSALLSFMPGNITYQNMNVNAGGVRVAKVITSDGVTNVSNVKKYFYSKLITPAISSGGVIFSPQYEKYLRVKVACMSGTPIDPNDPYSVINCDLQEYDFYSMYSSTLNNIYIYPSAPVSYSHVVESFGENYENGGIEHQYTVFEDQPAYSIAGDDLMLSAPLSSYAWKNARELVQYVFKKQATSYIPVKKVFTNYKEDTRVDQDIKAYVVNKKYTVYCEDTPPSDNEINAYDLLAYSNFRKWVYVDTVKTWTYDIKGQNYLEQLNISEYANVTHALPTKQITYSSDNISSSATTAYPQDLTLTGSEETARQTLISKYMIGVPLQQQVYKGPGQLFNLKTGYNVFTNGLVLPQTQTVQKTGYSAEERTKVYEYNNYGKILEQSKTNDTRQSYIWSDLGIYPLAQVINASVATIAFASFEPEGKGGWTYTGTPLADASAPTGKNIYQTVSPVSKSGLPSGTYIVSYWSKNSDGASQTVNATTGTAGPNINGWTYYEHKIINPVSGTITVSGSGKIDELRLYPEKAQMISYTYEPIIGITSQTDANNRTTYYEYDALGRLKLIKDNDRSILKTFDYHYQQAN